MIADAVEPVFGVRVVGLATMDDRVNVTAVAVFDVLHDLVRQVQMVVPDEDRGAEQFPCAEFLQFLISVFSGKTPWRGPGPSSGGSGVSRRFLTSPVTRPSR